MKKTRQVYLRQLEVGPYNHNPCFFCLANVETCTELRKLCQIPNVKAPLGVNATCMRCHGNKNRDCLQVGQSGPEWASSANSNRFRRSTSGNGGI